MTIRVKVLISILVIGVSLAIGRFTAPEKIKTIEVEKKVDTNKSDAEKDVHKKTTTTKITLPTGAITEVTVTTDDSVLSKKSSQVDVDTDSKSKEIVRNSGILRISALAGTSVINPALVYGLSINRNLIGPINFGAWGLTSGVVGVSVGIDF